MSRQDNSIPGKTSSKSLADLYESIKEYWTEEIQKNLDAMIDNIQDLDDWLLTPSEIDHLVKQVADKKGSIKSSFAFQLRKNLNDFKNMRKTRSHKEMAQGWRGTDSLSQEGPEQNPELNSTIQEFGQKYSEINSILFQKLQVCVSRSDVEEKEHPLGIANLCYSFRNSIDSLNLDTKYEAGFYRYFGSRILGELGPYYQKVDAVLTKQGVTLDAAPAEDKKSNAPGPREIRARSKSEKKLSEQFAPASLPLSRKHELLCLLHDHKKSTRLGAKLASNVCLDIKKELAELKIQDIDRELAHVSSLFSYALDNQKLPEVVKAQLARLQIYFLISAINEPGFVDKTTHPAYMLLDSVINSELELIDEGCSRQSGYLVLKEGINRLIARRTLVAKNYSELLALYQKYIDSVKKEIRSRDLEEKTRREQRLKKEAELQQAKLAEAERLEKAKQEERRKILEQQEQLKKAEEQEKQDKIKQQELIKQAEEQEKQKRIKALALKKQKEDQDIKQKALQLAKVKQMVKAAVEELTIPLLALNKPFILFDKVWTPLLLQIALREGMKSEIWEKTLRMARTQVWSLIPKSKPNELQKLQALRPHISGSLVRGMRSLKLSPGLQKSLAEYLKLEFDEVLKRSQRNVDIVKNKLAAKQASQAPSAKKPAKSEDKMPEIDPQLLGSGSRHSGSDDSEDLVIEDSDDTTIEGSENMIIEDIEDFSQSMQTGIYQLSSDMLRALNSVVPGGGKQKAKSNEADIIQKGDWVELKQGSAKTMAKLSWRAADNSLFIFIDSGGKRILEVDGAELNSKIDSGEMKPVNSSSFDSSKNQFNAGYTPKS